jgi:hypothetical protein
MPLLNQSFASQLGRPDLVYTAQTNALYGGAPPTIVGGSGGFGAAIGGDAGSPLTGGGRHALLFLLALVGAYAAFTWWVRPHLA